ncbi:hypothetical protein ABMC88_00160 [Sulfitobacter sp. HNIBRBA2951]|uniref:hypothetical protein n=1 Tax=Sulfitobacter aquimarinus TaxID=3158557 RepID=UPI0032DF3BD8
MTPQDETTPLRAWHWILSGVSAVLILHLVGFLLSRAVFLAELRDLRVGPNLYMIVISIQLTAVVAWVYLPFALFWLRRATRRGKGGFGRAAVIGVVFPAASWCVVAPLTQMLIPALIGASMLSGVAIGVMTWLILTGWHLAATRRSLPA